VGVTVLTVSVLAGCTKQPDPRPQSEDEPAAATQPGPAKTAVKKTSTPGAPETPAQPPAEKPILVSAVELVKAFNDDRAAAAKRYQGKTIFVNGVVALIDPPDEGIGGTVTLEGVPPEEIEPGKVKEVLCNLRYGSQTDRLQEDQPIKVQGVCAGVSFRQVVELTNATVVERHRIPEDVLKKKQEAEKALALLKGLGVGYSEAPGGYWEIFLRPEHLTAGGQLRPEVVAALLKIPRLRGVSVESAPLTDAGLEGLKPFTRLEKLGLEGTRVTDAGLVHLKALARLRSLDLAGTAVTNDAPGLLTGLRYLESLGLAGTQVNDAGLAQMKSFPRLRSLYLTDTAVSDAGLEDLAGLPLLAELGLAKTKITDAGLKGLGGVKSLKLLTLSRKGLTPAAVEQLKETVPGLEVKYAD
jgi:hypothetical protein